MTLVLGFLLYYGSSLIPLGYLVFAPAGGRCRRALRIALGCQLVASLAVLAFTWWCRGAGYREWYWSLAWNLPVNAIFGIGYIVLLCDALGGSDRASTRSRQPP